MSKRVFCAFDRDEIEGYLRGGLPVEVLGWNPDPEAVEGVVESILQRILDGVTDHDWKSGSIKSVEIENPGEFTIVIGNYGDHENVWIAVGDHPISGRSAFETVATPIPLTRNIKDLKRGWPPLWRYLTPAETMQRLRDWNDAWDKIDEERRQRKAREEVQ